MKYGTSDETSESWRSMTNEWVEWLWRGGTGRSGATRADSHVQCCSSSWIIHRESRAARPLTHETTETPNRPLLCLRCEWEAFPEFCWVPGTFSRRVFPVPIPETMKWDMTPPSNCVMQLQLENVRVNDADAGCSTRSLLNMLVSTERKVFTTCKKKRMSVFVNVPGLKLFERLRYKA